VEINSIDDNQEEIAGYLDI